MAASSPAVRRRAPARSKVWTRLGFAGVAAIVVVLVLPLFFAGSKNRLAAGTRIGGIDPAAGADVGVNVVEVLVGQRPHVESAAQERRRQRGRGPRGALRRLW